MEKILIRTTLLSVVFFGLFTVSCGTSGNKSKVTGSWIGELSGFERIGEKSSGIFIKKIGPFPRIKALTLKSVEITFSNETNLDIISNETYYKIREIFFKAMQKAVSEHIKKPAEQAKHHYFLDITLTNVTLTKLDSDSNDFPNSTQIFDFKKAEIQAELRDSATNSRHAIMVHAVKQPQVEIKMIPSIFATLASKLYRDIRVLRNQTK
tara:strand:- start:401 stop:1027 length:627 start_codon:yes stop_codon:yes gene_type:complete